MRNQLQYACEQGEIRPLDFHIGLFLEKQGDQKSEGKSSGNPTLLLAATLASAAVGNGHVCQPLDQASALFPTLFASKDDLFPSPEKWRNILLSTPVVGYPGEISPLILDKKNRLYLYRFYCYEEFIASELLKRAGDSIKFDQRAARLLLTRLFPQDKENREINFQQLAAILALIKPLLIISGGPGTGKTHTVARILALIQALQEKKNISQGSNKNRLRIALAAPTGKAAARLEESIRKAKKSIPDDLSQAIPEQAQTLHRLLGSRPGADDFRYNRNNLLHLDLLILDEASMIDVVLMAALLQALPSQTRIILLGDRNQLASVEAGSLFGDLCGNGESIWSVQLCTKLEQVTGKVGLSSAPSVDAMADSLVFLQTSYRFQENSGIGCLAAAVNSGSMENVDRVIMANFSDLKVTHCTGGARDTWLREEISQGFQAMMRAPSLEEAFAAMERFRLLCALRRGPFGVEGINIMVTQVLRKSGLIVRGTDWYQGKPIIILRNQYDMQLFNGDTGILWKNDQGQLRAWFRRPDNSLYSISPVRLPEHETAYAVTIHKAQGSEFDKVVLLLPDEDSRVLSRELLYTGITRARSKLALCSERDILEMAIKRRTTRFSGLAEKLRRRKED
ncbi:MAG: exodeoxyribonuclease V subunit alpha [Candidatus Electrothrix sp. AR4]|nr:exodeoxyribonuclease V subunit alpha [Candidatus Electrothrix sp. AR4]